MFGKGQKKQDVCLMSETNSVSDERLIVGTTHAESPDTAEAWGLDSKQQCRDGKTGRYIQFISSLNCDPVPIYKNVDTKSIKTDTALISSQTEDKELVFVETNGSKNSTLTWVGICMALLTLTLCVIALVNVMGD